MTEIFEFAKNAVDLPKDPTSYIQNTAYKSKPDNQFISNGFGSQIYVDTAPLNYYLNRLTSFVKTFKNYGVINEKAYNDLFTPDNPREGDVYLKGDDFRLYYFKEGKERLLEECATSEETGLITDPFMNSDPMNLIPSANRDREGYCFGFNIVRKKDFNLLMDSLLKTNKENAEEKQTVPISSSLYFFARKNQKALLSLSSREGFFGLHFNSLQKVYVSNVILLAYYDKVPLFFHLSDDCEDFYTLEYGTICY